MPLSTHLLITTTRAMARLGSRTSRSFETSALSPALDPPDRSADIRLIDHCGFMSHYSAARSLSDWPLPVGMTVQQLAIFAMAQDLLRGEPAAGDLFLQYSPSRKCFVHAGIVMGVLFSGQFNASARFFDVYTIEGDVDSLGRRGGGRTMKIRRRLTSAHGDRFIRWTALENPSRVSVDAQWNAFTARST